MEHHFCLFELDTLDVLMGSPITSFLRLILVSVCKTIERLMRNFFWEGRDEGGCSPHLVKWGLVSKLMELRGCIT